MRRTEAILALVALAASACTTFYGVEPDPHGSSSASTGAGGKPLFEPTSLLPIYDAAHLCGLVATCPTLGDSVLASTGLPLVIPSVSDARNFSLCVDWLTAPLAPDEDGVPRAGFAQLRSMIVCMAATSTCKDAGACAFAEVLDPVDQRCDVETGTRCEGGTAIDCAASPPVVAHCDSKGFAPGSECFVGTNDVAACAVGACSTPSLSCDQAPDPGPSEPSYVFGCDEFGLRHGADCRASGLVCNDAGAVGDRGCYGVTGKAKCDTFGQASCMNEHALVCSGLVFGEVDCAAMGETCVGDGSTARCAPAASGCSPFDANVNVCDATLTSTIHLCVRGQKVDFDCASIGATCQPGVGAMTGHCE